MRCQICGGPIYQSTVGSGFHHPVWIHADPGDWEEVPHNAVPDPEGEDDGSELEGEGIVWG